LIYIYVRRTLDWAREDGESIDPQMRSKVRLWDATFTIPYHAFRDRVAQIAELNHSRVHGVKRAKWDEIPEDALVLPVDDDDWFAPDAGVILEREREPAATSYVWDSRWIEVPTGLRHHLWLIRRRLIPGTPQRWLCTTNNYAVVKGPGSKELLASPREASRSFQARLERADRTVKRIDARLSVANRTLASQTSLRPQQATITRSLLIRKFRRYKRLYKQPLPRELDWCQLYLRMMSELMDGLEVKR
jgi:hypothetical protein